MCHRRRLPRLTYIDVLWPDLFNAANFTATSVITSLLARRSRSLRPASSAYGCRALVGDHVLDPWFRRVLLRLQYFRQFFLLLLSRRDQVDRLRIESREELVRRINANWLDLLLAGCRVSIFLYGGLQRDATAFLLD